MSRAITIAPLWAAQRAAESLRQTLAPVCTQVAVAGSVRRLADTVKDLELLAVARIGSDDPQSLFADEYDQLERLLSKVSSGIGGPAGLLRPRVKGQRAQPWGPKYKRLLWQDGERWFAVDLFIVTAATWGVQLALRTGPADFSRLLVTAREDGGAMPAGWRCHEGRIETPGGVLDTPTEADVFAALGVPHWKPQHRCERLLREHLQGGGRSALTPSRRKPDARTLTQGQ